MAISNCLSSSTLEIPEEFPTWCVLVKLSANPRNYSYPRPLATRPTKQNGSLDSNNRITKTGLN